MPSGVISVEGVAFVLHRPESFEWVAGDVRKSNASINKKMKAYSEKHRRSHHKTCQARVIITSCKPWFYSSEIIKPYRKP